ncbi:RNA-directed DNA polymerase [Sphingobium sp. TB-6]|uniref:antiviral reverse transcriptase Drt3b n=1 Tax=Sphingobium sp. TB-6 TaxID=2728850 RepID=UPI00146AF0D0|nr:antiviral reverse transcriptase Drt3b [Sphingobium sp. TB-6]NML91208.1 RNA-directed DNA polymerase [Sphingobium sp. TB-6]
MRKSVIAKGNIHPNDHARALVTDTLPGDVPIVVSNDGFYKNIKAIPHANGHYQEFIDRLLKRARPYTIPYRYNILRPNGSPRKLSLMHPSGQIEVANFYREYGNLIAYFCRKSDASIRSPRKVGSLFFVRGRGSEKNKLKGAGIDTTNLENTVSNPASYFAYSGYDRIYKFFNSTDYMRLEKKYAVMYFADISKCFNSIYTHTLFWATADVATAKDNTSVAGFSNAFDKLMQSVNYNETNGICVGAEVSRIFAELILSEVDKRAIENLRKDSLNFKINYEFRRYVDDFIIFADDDVVAQKVMSSIKIALRGCVRTVS